MPIRPVCAGLILAPFLLLSGCAYVHFGRIPPTDAALMRENLDLQIDKAMLKQELAIAHKEGDALRSTLDASANGADVPTLTKQLAEATRELSALRVSAARLALRGNIRTPQGSVVEMEALKRQLAASREGEAAARRDTAVLRVENQTLKRQLDAQKVENRALADQVQGLTSDSGRLREAISQLNAELLAQKEARNRAEQSVAAAKDELRMVLSQQSAAAPASLGSSFGALREGMVSGAASMGSAAPTVAKVGADGSTMVLLKAHNPRSGAVAEAAGANPAMAVPKLRTYVVQQGDTLEKIAKEFYGTTERWSWIYAANNELLRGERPLQPGMKLVIPDSSEVTP